MQLMHNVDLATEVTLQPLDRFALDAAILFSDILTVPDAMGLGLSFVEGEGPQFAHPVQDETAVQRLVAQGIPDLEKWRYVFEAVSSIRRALHGRVPLIGFSGSPFTLACYMVEGKGGTDYRHIKTMLYDRPELLHALLDLNARTVAAYLNAQIEAGAQAVMLFDSWGGILAHQAFPAFSLAYTQKVLSQLHTSHQGQPIPRLVFTKGGGLWLAQMADLSCEVLGVDWTVDLGQARLQVGHSKALQGNLDPAVLFASPKKIEAQVLATLQNFGPPHTALETTGPTHIFNLGHGISMHTPPDHVTVLVDTVHQLSAAWRTQ